MDIGGEEEDSSLIHSKFHKARRGLLRSKSASSEGGEESVCRSEIEKLSLEPIGEGTEKPSLTSEQAETHHHSLTGQIVTLPSRTSNVEEPTSGYFSSFGTKLRHQESVIKTNPIHSPYLRELQHHHHHHHQHIPQSAPPELQSSEPGTSFPSEVFRFDSTDRERYLCAAISEEEEVFTISHETSLFTQSFDSPHIVLDSPPASAGVGCEQSFQQLTDELPPTSFAGGTDTTFLTPHSHMESQSRIMARVHTGLTMLPSSTVEQTSGLFGGIPSSPISPLTPNTPLSPSPLFATEQMFHQGFLAELYRRRCHSDSDLPFLPETTTAHEPTDLSMKSHNWKAHGIKTRKPIPHPLTIPSKGGSLESDQSTPQDSPLDLSVRASRDRFGSSNSCDSLTSRFLSSLANPTTTTGVAVIRGDIASPTTRNSVAQRYNLDVSPVVEEIPPGADMAFVCPLCGQMFSLHDRLAKHMASRHKSKPHDPNKNYPCDVCHRSFARSDMLTRHMRLHTGVKPYTCRTCGQVFSRSDHLSTHQRTHTGEKPYKCPQCCYSACRRDMITRHLRTHTRNTSSSSSSDVTSTTSTPTSTTFSASDSLPSDDFLLRPIKLEPSRPPSSSSSFAPDSPTPLSPALNISALSVRSPPEFFQKDQ